MIPSQEGMELDWLKRWNHYRPRATALIDADSDRRWSYGELYESSLRGAQALRGWDIKDGDRVAVVAGNSPEYLILCFSLQRLGAILVPINFRLSPPEISYIIQDSGAKILFFDEEFRGEIERIDVPTTQIPLTSNTTGFKQALETKKTDSEHFDLDLVEMKSARSESLVMILYTSGTTGFPKGAMISHRMLFWNSINTSWRLDLTTQDRAVIFLPFFHTGGWNVLTTPFLHRGAQIILTRKFDAERVLELSSRFGATLLFGVPTTMNMMAQTEAFKSLDLSSIRYAIVGGESMPLPLINTWAAKEIPIRQGYGLTEFGPNVFSLGEEFALEKIGSIGLPNFYIEAKVIDDEGRELGPEQIGELILKGPMCMSGYWNNETATQEVLKEGWLHTGDLARRDSDGFYFIAGRKKEMFISGGENVYPVEVEQVLQKHPEIREVAVVGIPDAKWGEVGRAYIVAQKPLSKAEMESFCRERLAKFKIPKDFVFVEELPKGDTGKILKRKLQEN